MAKDFLKLQYQVLKKICASKSLIMLMALEIGTFTLENWQYLFRPNKAKQNDPKIPLLGIYTKEMTTYVHQNIYKNVHSIFS